MNNKLLFDDLQFCVFSVFVKRSNWLDLSKTSHCVGMRDEILNLKAFIKDLRDNVEEYEELMFGERKV